MGNKYLRNASDTGDASKKDEDPDEDNCNTEFYKRVKFSKNQGVIKYFPDYYDPETEAENEEILLFEMVIKQDATKTVNQRQSTQILDWLGDVGGFKEALLMLFYIVGEYFSAKMLLASVAEKFFLTKKDAPKPQEKKQPNDEPNSGTLKKFKEESNSDDDRSAGTKGVSVENIDGLFKKINISVVMLLIDPLVSICCFPFNSCTRCFCIRQRKILE